MAYMPNTFYPAISGYPVVDPFGGIRTSQALTLLDTTLQYDLQPLFWQTVLVGGGSMTHLPNESAGRLRCGTTNGDKVTRQTFRYYPYQPGKGQRMEMTGVLGAAKANVETRIGYFDDSNGVFFDMRSTGPGIVVRSFVTGSVVNTRVAQASWNIDKMNGTGPSGITLDFSKAQIFLIDLEWLGVGTVAYGVMVDRVLHYVHWQHHANSVTTTYMTTACLPVRYEIENTAGTASQTDLLQICCTVKSEGGRVEIPTIFSRSNGVTTRAVGATEVPVLSIRPDTKFPAGGSITNRKSLFPVSLDIFSEDAPVYWRLVYNPTWTGAAWVDHDTTYSGVEYDVSATSITGGLQIAEGFISTATRGGVDTQRLASDMAGSLDYAGTAQRGFAVCITRIGALSSDCSVAIQWREV